MPEMPLTSSPVTSLSRLRGPSDYSDESVVPPQSLAGTSKTESTTTNDHIPGVLLAM